MDWDREPELRIFRPGPPVFKDSYLLDPDSDEPVVSVAMIRRVIKGEPGEQEEGEENIAIPGLIAYKKLIDLLAYLDIHFPPYPPLADFVKE